MAVQQVVANDYSHLGVDVRAGREQQPGHLEAAVDRDAVQGIKAAPALRDPGWLGQFAEPVNLSPFLIEALANSRGVTAVNGSLTFQPTG